MNHWYWILIGVVGLIILLVLYLKRVKHGWVQLRTGLVLKIMPALDSRPVVPLRHAIEKFAASRHPKVKKKLPVNLIKEIEIPTRHGPIDARIFDNNDLKGQHNIVFIHGGGWCIGSLNTYEEVCRRLARETKQTVISLGYSLAPEHPFPRAHEECLDAVSKVSQEAETLGLDSKPLILIGDSAGGNLILASYFSADEKVRKTVVKMVPVYPAVDSKKTDYYSSIAFANGYYLTQKSMMQFTEALITSEGDLNDIRLSPIDQEDLSNFPDSFFITAAYDPLRDQGEAMAEKLHQQGSSVFLKRYKETIHAFFGLADFGSQGVRAIEDIARFIEGKEIADLKITSH